MPSLLYIPRFDESGAGPRYRVYQYLDSFRKLGIDITVRPLFDIKYLNNLYFNKKRSIFNIGKVYFNRALFLTLRKSKFDIVLMDGELFPFVPYFIEKLFLPKHYVIDQDDAIFHTYDNHRFSWVRKLLGQKIAKIWRHSYHLIIGNEYIKKVAIEMGAKRVTALPTAINANIYKPVEAENQPLKTEIVIGWVGSPTTVHFFSHMQQALINIAQQKNIVLYVIGANYHLAGVKTVCIDWKDGWSESEEIKWMNKIDIGIMPLVDGPYEKGKGGFKLIKYMSCKKPMIASAVGMNIEIVDHDVNGFLVNSIAEWEANLLKLIEQPQLRQKMGENGREKMIAKYSFQAVNPVLCDVITQALREKPSN